MLYLILFVTLLLLFSSNLRVNANCGDYVITTSKLYTCTSSTHDIFTISSLPQIPTGGRTIFLQGEVQLQSDCSLTDQRVVVLTIEPVSGSPIKLMDLYWNGASTVAYASQDSTGVKIAQTVATDNPQPANQWGTFTIWVKLATNEASGSYTYYGLGSSVSPATVSYPATWTIDMNPKIYVCSDSNGVDVIRCRMTYLKVWYDSSYNEVQATYGTIPVLAAQYRLNQYTGYAINNNVNTANPAYLGSSTSSGEDPIAANKPSWIPATNLTTGEPMAYTGLEFDQSTEYVTLPTFSLSESAKTPAYSFTLKLWLKLMSPPTSENYLFRYSQSSMVTDIYALKVATDRRIKIVNYGQSVYSTNQLSQTTWNSIIVTFTNMDYATTPSSPGFYTYISILINNNHNDISTTLQPSTQFVYDSSNVVRIGGPPTVLGVIAGLEIYSPGTNLMSETAVCTPSTCSRDFGITSPSTCILPVCTANCDVCFNSQDTGCLQCSTNYGLYQSKCVPPSYPTGQILSSTYTCQSICDSSYFCYPEDGICRSTCSYPYMIVTQSSVPYCILDITEEDANQARQVALVSTTAAAAANLGGMIAIILTNNPTLLLTSSLTEMLQYIQYLNISYPPKVEHMLDGQNVNSGGITIITNIPQSVADAIPNRPLPEEFEKNDTHSSFIANNWQFLISLCAIIMGICIVSAFKLFTKDYRRIQSFLKMILDPLRWGLFLGVFCSSYGFAGMYTALEFRTVNTSSGLSLVSFIVSLIINTLGFLIFYLIIRLGFAFTNIKKTTKIEVQQTKRFEELEQKWKGYEVLFGDYKNGFVSQKIYLFIFMLRTYIHYGILGYLNDYPFAQTCGFTIISILMILYMIIRRPIKSIVNYIQQMLCEMTILVINVCVLILATMEKFNKVNSDFRISVGNVIIITNLVLSVVSSVFLVIEGLSQIKEAYLWLKKCRKRVRSSQQLNLRSNYLGRPHKLKKIRRNFPSEVGANELEISNLDRDNDSSMVQLKP